MIFRAIYEVLEMHLSRLWKEYVVLIGVFLVLGLLLLKVFVCPPSGFPTNQMVVVPAGTSVTSTARLLAQQHVIRSPLMFRLLVEVIPQVRGVQSGTYVFAEPASVVRVAWNLTHAITGLHTVRLTFPEGTPVRTMGDKLASALPSFEGERFKSLALPYEGYLFPDTYFFSPSQTPEEIIALMRANYAAHSDWKKGITLTEKSERDAVILASLLEGEAKTLTDKKIIAGILIKRMNLGMPLQVDATFGYIYGKTGYVPTRADIEGNSAYNSYRMRGLPPTPINNPGEESLLAAVTPTKTPYLYYLTGSDGQMHYAKTFAEHIANQHTYFK